MKRKLRWGIEIRYVITENRQQAEIHLTWCDLRKKILNKKTKTKILSGHN